MWHGFGSDLGNEGWVIGLGKREVLRQERLGLGVGLRLSVSYDFGGF
jgi:hypothetical protein